ncbi:hypothetical protein ACFFK7_19560 [Pseudoalteromonas xiamenensis]|uniref:hypothetical protein n=1 Tax=Pseudoalteromonas xiamenensis TaxID=882626 RepID=UPI0035EFE00D
MKNILLISLLSFALPSLAASKIAQEHIDTDEGFPYKNLIMKADRVELSYKEHGDEVECRVAIITANNTHQGTPKTTKAKNLRHKPMTACLSRDEAKQFLAQL